MLPKGGVQVGPNFGWPQQILQMTTVLWVHGIVGTLPGTVELRLTADLGGCSQHQGQHIPGRRNEFGSQLSEVEATVKLSRAVEYAIRATLQLARWEGGSPIACRRLADAENLPERFLLQILRALVEQGVLRSTRGVEGGYRLSRSPDQISVLEVIEAVEGRITATPVNSESLPAGVISKLRIELAHGVEAVRGHLGAVMISDLIDVDEISPQPADPAPTT